MWIPLDLHFNGEKNREDSNKVCIPKIYQGAPYEQAIKVKQADGSYRDFSIFAEMRMHIRLNQNDTTPILTLTRTGGHLIGLVDQFRINIAATDTDHLNIPFNKGPNINNVAFVFDIEFENVYSVVTERFAMGTGIFSTNTTRTP